MTVKEKAEYEQLRCVLSFLSHNVLTLVTEVTDRHHLMIHQVTTNGFLGHSVLLSLQGHPLACHKFQFFSEEVTETEDLVGRLSEACCAPLPRAAWEVRLSQQTRGPWQCCLWISVGHTPLILTINNLFLR